MPENSNTVTFTDAERDAVIGWAGMAAVGFHFGPPSPGQTDSPSITALKKLEATKEG